jgi:hypothetical protein
MCPHTTIYVYVSSYYFICMCAYTLCGCALTFVAPRMLTYADVCWRMHLYICIYVCSYSRRVCPHICRSPLDCVLPSASAPGTYADVCWRMLTYADVCWRMLAYAPLDCVLPSASALGVCMCPHTMIYVSSYYDICVLMLLFMRPHATVCVLMLQCLYADVCWRMLTYADVCWRMLTSSCYSARTVLPLWRPLSQSTASSSSP